MYFNLLGKVFISRQSLVLVELYSSTAAEVFSCWLDLIPSIRHILGWTLAYIYFIFPTIELGAGVLFVRLTPLAMGLEILRSMVVLTKTDLIRQTVQKASDIRLSTYPTLRCDTRGGFLLK